MPNDERLISILRAADKHPNSNVSKLIRQFHAEPTSKNIVLLLMELAEHTEYVVDFDISLGYYLDKFSELLRREHIGFNDTGVFLHNSSKIYGRRVDCFYDHVNEHIKSFSSADTADGDPSNGANPQATSTPAAGRRKRVIASAPDPYELEMTLKKFRSLAGEKRFQAAECVKKPKQLFQHIMDGDHVHPAQWLHSRLCDFDNHDETDSKRNYKLFTYNLEHRYNTLVPDINFRLHFKMKDYMLEAEQRDDNALAVWSQDHNHYTDKYLSLENRIFSAELSKTTTTTNDLTDGCDQDDDFGDQLPRPPSPIEGSIDTGYGTTMMQSSTQNDTGNKTKGCDEQPSECNASLLNCTENISMLINKDTSCSQEGFTQLNSTAHGNAQITAPLDDSGIGTFQDTQHGSTVVTGGEEMASTSSAVQEASHETMETSNEAGEDLKNVTVNFRPVLDEDNVPFLELSARQRAMLLPKVMVTDVFPRIPNKQNLTLIVDDEIMAMHDLPERETFAITESACPEPPKVPVVLNILKMHEKLLRRRSLFTLGLDFKLYKDQRRDRRTRKPEEVSKRKFKPPQTPALPDSDDSASVSQPKRLLMEAHKAKSQRLSLGFGEFSPDALDDDSDGDFCGFAETPVGPAVVEAPCGGNAQSKLQRLSKDSGIDEDGMQASSAEETTGTDDSGHPNDSASQMPLSESIAEARDGALPQLAAEFDEPDDRCDNEVPDATPMDADESVEAPNAELSTRSFLLDNANPSEMPEMEPPPSIPKGEIDHVKIRKWHEKLQPILANSQERNHFNIFDLGTDVMNTFEQSPQGASRPPPIDFGSVMESRSKLDVSRYLLAVLVLVNQGNLSIQKQDRPADQPSKWEDLQLSLLKTERHNVDIADDIGRIATSSAMAEANTSRPAQKRTAERKVKSKPPSLYRPSIDDDDDECGDVFSPPSTPNDSAARFSVPKRSRLVSTPASPPSPNTRTAQGRSLMVSCDLSAIRPIRKIEQQQREDDMDSGVCSNMD